MKIDKNYIWDYNVRTIDLSKPEILRWYLSRQVNFGNWQKINGKILEKHLMRLNIDPMLKKMLAKYYVSKRAKNNS